MMLRSNQLGLPADYGGQHCAVCSQDCVPDLQHALSEAWRGEHAGTLAQDVLTALSDITADLSSPAQVIGTLAGKRGEDALVVATRAAADAVRTVAAGRRVHKDEWHSAQRVLAGMLPQPSRATWRATLSRERGVQAQTSPDADTAGVRRRIAQGAAQAVGRAASAVARSVRVWRQMAGVSAWTGAVPGDDEGEDGLLPDERLEEMEEYDWDTDDSVSQGEGSDAEGDAGQPQQRPTAASSTKAQRERGGPRAWLESTAGRGRCWTQGASAAVPRPSVSGT